MAKRKGVTYAPGDGSDVPAESVELDGNIVTAATSTMEARSFERGYPLPTNFLGMDQINSVVGRRK